MPLLPLCALLQSFVARSALVPLQSVAIPETVLSVDSRHVQFDSRFNVMHGKCSSLKLTRSHFLLPHHPALSLLEVELENVIHLTFLEEFPVLLLVPDDTGFVLPQ